MSASAGVGLHRARHPRGRQRQRQRRRQRGAALLLAMLILTLVVTIAAGMVWQQTRAIEVESAERARAQSAWVLHGALDWARLILIEDGRSGRERGRNFDSLDEPWATPLAEARLSTFLAVDQDNNTDSGPEAFLSGAIEDAQSRYNLRGLLDPSGAVVPEAVDALQQLTRAAGLPDDTAVRLASALTSTWAAGREGEGAGSPSAGAPLPPQRLGDLAWADLDAASLAQLAPWVDLLPQRTPVNVNTAPAEVLMAAIDGLDRGSAERLVQRRQREPFASLDAVRAVVGENLVLVPERVAVASRYFYIRGRLRLDERVLEERSLVERRGADGGGGGDVVVVRRERLGAGGGG